MTPTIIIGVIIGIATLGIMPVGLFSDQIGFEKYVPEIQAAETAEEIDQLIESMSKDEKIMESACPQILKEFEELSQELHENSRQVTESDMEKWYDAHEASLFCKGLEKLSKQEVEKIPGEQYLTHFVLEGLTCDDINNKLKERSQQENLDESASVNDYWQRMYEKYCR